MTQDRNVDQDRKEGGMPAIRTTFRRLRSDKRGATAIEYALIAALIAMALLASITSLGGSANGMWGRTANEIGNAM